MGLRHLGRELALKALYQIDIRGGSSREELALLFESFQADDRARKFAVELVEGVERERARATASRAAAGSTPRFRSTLNVKHAAPVLFV